MYKTIQEGAPNDQSLCTTYVYLMQIRYIVAAFMLPQKIFVFSLPEMASSILRHFFFTSCELKFGYTLQWSPKIQGGEHIVKGASTPSSTPLNEAAKQHPTELSPNYTSLQI